jgi:hypothetical protein
MTADEHIAAADGFLGQSIKAWNDSEAARDDEAARCVAIAQVHATLALVEATIAGNRLRAPYTGPGYGR